MIHVVKPIQAYIAGLPENYRGEPLEEQLTAHGIEWRRSPGVRYVEGAAYETSVDREAAHVMLRRPMSFGEIGCALAHRGVYEDMVNRGVEWALIFEDDARLLQSEELTVLGPILGNPEPTVVLLSFRPGTTVTFGPAVTNTRIRRTVVPPTTTTAYALNGSAARAILATGAVAHVADWPVAAYTSVKFLAPQTPIAAPDPSESSTIGERVGGRSSRPLGTLSRLSRRLVAASHVTWVRHRATYGNYRNFIIHEFVRMPVFAWAARASARQNDPGAVSAGPALSLLARSWNR